MAQIRKYQSGGRTPKNIGVLTIDGKEYTGDGFIQHMRDYRKTLDDKVADQFGNIINALKAGENLQYDSDTDVLTGNVNWNVSKVQEKRLDKGEDRTKIGKVFGGLNEGKEQRVRYAINALRNMGAYEEPKAEIKGKSIDWSKDINLVYSKGKDGKRTFSKLDNASAIERLKQFATLIGNDWTDNDTFTGYNGLTRDQYMTAYTNLADVISAIENGTWDKNTLQVLKDFGIFDNGGSSTSSKTGNVSTSAGNGGSDTTNRYFTTDSNGDLVATDALKALYPGNAIFNDFWEKSSGYRDEYKGLKGLIKFENKLYKISDLDNPNSPIYRYLQNNNIINLIKQNKFEDANKQIKFLWDTKLDSILYDPTKYYHPAMQDWSLEQQYRYRPLTGIYQYTGTDYINPDIIEYWNAETERDPLGLPKTYNYAIISDNRLIPIDSTKLKKLNTGNQKSVGMYPVIQDDGPYKGYIEHKIKDVNNNDLATYYINPNDPNADVFFWYKTFANYPDLLKNWNFKISRNIWNLLNTNSQFWSNLAHNIDSGNLQTHWTNAFTDAVGTAARDVRQRELEINDWIKLGFDQSDANTLYNYFSETLGNDNDSQIVRQEKFRIPKRQTGGLIGTVPEHNSVTPIKKLDVKAKDTTKPVSKDNPGLTAADWAEIVSLGADVCALVSGWLTGGGNPVAAGLGVTGTLTSFGAGVTRDGLDWGDAGNLLLGLGLDVASLFPGLGLGSTATKVVKSVKKVGGVLNTLLMGVGAIDAVKGIKNIAEGKGSINDYRSLMNGLLVLNKVIPDLKLLKNTTFKGKLPNNVKNAAALKKEFVDGIIAKGKQNGVDLIHELKLIDEQGKINYDAAYNALKDSKYINEWGLTAWLRDLRGKINEWSAPIVNNTIHGSWNPFSKNYRFNIDNRVLKPEVLAEPYKYKRIIADYGLDNIPQESWPKTNAIEGFRTYILPTKSLWGTNVMHRYETKQKLDLDEIRRNQLKGSYKHGGVIKADKGWKYDTNYNPYVGWSIYPIKAADLAPDLEIPSFVKQPHSTTITFPQYKAYKGIKRPILVGKATKFPDFDNRYMNIPAVNGSVDLSNIKLFTDSISGTQTNNLQHTNTPDVTQTPKGAGEDPPKWKQNLKDYASRAFNYENLNTLGQVIGAVVANHKVAKVKEDALKSMPLSRNVFQASIPTYYENTRGFDVRRNALLNIQLPQTADAKLNAQWKLNMLSELDKVNREKYDYLSQNRNQYNQFVNQIENRNRELRTAESNAFIDRLSQRDMALAENTAGMIANDFKTFEQALKKGLYNYQQDRALYDQLALSDRKKMLFNKYSEKAANWTKTNPAAENEIYMSDIDRYFKYNPGDKDQYDNDMMQLNRSIYRPRSIWSPQFDKGGKLSAQDHIKINKHKSQDRILENKYKAIDKAVQKLNDNVVKIFLNMMK